VGDAVRARLPRAFTTADRAKATPSLKAHPLSRKVVLARWSRAGAIKKSGPAKYAKVGRAEV
jgi:hypothetical protein